MTLALAFTNRRLALLVGMRADGYGAEDIAVRLKVTKDDVLGAFDRLDELHDDAIRKATLAAPRATRTLRGDPVHHLVADAQRRAGLAHASLTSALLGDPLPGRSALEVRR